MSSPGRVVIAVALGVLSVFSSACSPDLSVPAGAQIECGADGSCPEGTKCQPSINLCIAENALGGGPPVPQNATVTPSFAKSGVQVEVRFESSKPLIQAPELWAEIQGDRLDFQPDTSQSSGTQYAFRYSVSGNEKQGIANLLVKLVDNAGNVSDGFPLGSFTLDFQAPTVSFATVEYVPLPDNPLGPAVTAATSGTTVRVIATASEPLGDGGTPSLTAHLVDGGPLQFTLDSIDSTHQSATFSTTINSANGSGDYVPVLSGWTDSAGNAVDSSFSPSVHVQTAAPALIVNQNQVEFLRSPFGNTAAEVLDGGFSFPAGPYFALAPADSLDGTPTLAPDTFQFAGGAKVARVQVWGSAAEDDLLGAVDPTRDGGAWPRVRLTSFDVPVVYVSGIDEAGNVSSPMRLDHAEWVATARPPSVGQNPNPLTSTTFAHAALDPSPGQAFLQQGGPVSGTDGSAMIARAALAWRNRTPDSPASLLGPAMAYDDRDGRVYLFGGSDSSNQPQDGFWTWDGAHWSQIPKQGLWPLHSRSGAMVYDDARDRLVLFGGITVGSAGSNDLWEWDGASWTPILQTGSWPAARSEFGMVYDSRRARTVLYGGGLDDPGGDPNLWEWDGTAWQSFAPGASGPVARYAHGMAYDSARGRTVVFGGLLADISDESQETWEWDGSSWTNPNPAGPPAKREPGAMGYDSVRAKVVLVGGLSILTNTQYQDVWDWDGTTWAPSVVGRVQPPAGFGSSSAYDPVARRLVYFASSSTTIPNPWLWDGSTWTPVQATPAAPTMTSDFAMAYDSFRKRVVLFGGLPDSGPHLDELWEYDGQQWLNRTPSPRPSSWPVARIDAVMAFDENRHVAVMFGGLKGTVSGTFSYTNEVWEWDGTSWILKSADNNFYPGRSSERNVLVWNGSRIVELGYNISLGHTLVYEWDGTSWTDRTPTSGPMPGDRLFESAAYDPNRHVIVYFGGQSQTGQVDSFNDLWEWDGSAWTERTPSGPLPEPRSQAGMAFDPTRGRVVLFGGFDQRDALGVRQFLQDLWEWDGTQWIDVTPAGEKPHARAHVGVGFDSTRSKLFVYGGTGEDVISEINTVTANLHDLWTTDNDPTRQPAIQFEVDTANSQFDWSQVSGLELRARCGASGVSADAGTNLDGASLAIWSNGSNENSPAGWRQVAVNGVASADAPPYLAAPDSAALDWKTTTDLDRYFLSRDQRIAIQCKALGASGSADAEARLAMDYVEARFKYSAPDAGGTP